MSGRLAGSARLGLGIDGEWRGGRTRLHGDVDRLGPSDGGVVHVETEAALDASVANAKAHGAVNVAVLLDAERKLGLEKAADLGKLGGVIENILAVVDVDGDERKRRIPRAPNEETRIGT